MSTVHNGASPGDFAPVTLMPGDPLRAKFIAENFFENPRLISSVRGMLAYTGDYRGKSVSVMGSGMGMASIGIYSHELFTSFGVEAIIRTGTCGGYSGKVDIFDIVLAQGASTDSSWAAQYGLGGTFCPLADFDLLMRAWEAAGAMGLRCEAGNVLSTDVFYTADEDAWRKWSSMGVLAVEMETAALYMNAARLGKKALSVLTVSDHFISGRATTSEQREKSFTSMIELALELI